MRWPPIKGGMSTTGVAGTQKIAFYRQSCTASDKSQSDFPRFQIIPLRAWRESRDDVIAIEGKLGSKKNGNNQDIPLHYNSLLSREIDTYAFKRLYNEQEGFRFQ